MRPLFVIFLALVFSAQAFAQESLGDVARQLRKKKLSYRTELDLVAETDDISMGPYLTQVLNRIRENWLDRLPARTGRTDYCAATIELAILREGAADAVRIIENCDQGELDSAALSAIKAAAPFPALPAAFDRSRLWLRADFQYNPGAKPQAAATSTPNSGTETAAK